MDYKRILTVQDASCVGQCSMTVALPIISACGIETAVIPSAVLSTHTAFGSFTFRDLTEEIPKIKEVWNKEDIKFSAVYTGYLGNKAQVSYVKDIMNECLTDDGLRIVDPAMADGGIHRLADSLLCIDVDHYDLRGKAHNRQCVGNRRADASASDDCDLVHNCIPRFFKKLT